MIPSREKILQVYQQIRRPLIHSAIYISGTIISGLVSLITFPILARLISVEDMGKYDFFMFMLLSAVPLVTLGIQTGMGAVVSEIHSKSIKPLLRKAIYASLSLTLLLTFILFFLIKIRLFKTFSYKLLWTWAICLASLSICRLSRAGLIWKQHPVRASLLLNGEWLLGAILGILTLILTHRYSVETYLSGVAFGFVVTSLVAFRILPFEEESKHPANEHIQFLKLLRLSYPYAITYSLFLLSSGIEKAVILKQTGPHLLGIYALVTKIGSIPKLIGSGILYAVVPEIVKPNEDRIRHVWPLLLFILTYSIIATVISAPLSQVLVYIFGGEKYLPAKTFIPLAVLSETLFLVPWTLNSILLRFKRTNLILTYGITTNAIVVLLAKHLVPTMGIYGALLSSIIGKVIGISVLFSQILPLATQHSRSLRS